MINLYNEDCLQALRRMDTDQYDLAIVDPPYGIGISNNPVRQKHKKKNWDNKIPDTEYFTELLRVSKNQVIWGANYFIEYLYNTQNFIIWNKLQPENFSLAMAEIAWSSIQKPIKIFTYSIHKHNQTNKIHPTQKPVELYKWILQNYAKEGDKILDTHLGSGSIAIACHDMGFSLDGYELDTDYFEAAKQRLEKHQQQLKLF